MSLTLIDLEKRAQRLLSNDTAIKILNVLGRGGTLRDATVATDTDTDTITDALLLLDEIGLVDPGPPDIAPADRAIALTDRGRSVADFLAGLGHHQQ